MSRLSDIAIRLEGAIPLAAVPERRGGLGGGVAAILTELAARLDAGERSNRDGHSVDVLATRVAGDMVHLIEQRLADREFVHASILGSRSKRVCASPNRRLRSRR